jgi:hypothetical protein
VIRTAVCAAPLGLGAGHTDITLSDLGVLRRRFQTVNLYRGLLQENELYSLSVRCIIGVSLLILRLFNDVFQLYRLSVVPLGSINSSLVPPNLPYKNSS